METTTPNNQMQSVIDFVARNGEPKVIALKHDNVETAALLVPKGFEAKPAHEFTDKLLPKPRRKHGTTELHELASLIEFVKLHAEPSTATFVNPSTGHVESVINAHAGDVDGQKWGDLRAKFSPSFSPEWDAWKKQNEKPMQTAEFCEFIEDRILDLALPPTGGPDASEAEQRVLRLAKDMGTRFALPEEVVKLSKGLRIHSKDEVEETFNAQTGESTLEFKSEYQARDGQRLDVPGLFCITIPIFKRGLVYRIPCRLRFRKAGAGVTWVYALIDADKALEHAIDEIQKSVADQTQRPVFLGLAPSAGR